MDYKEMNDLLSALDYTAYKLESIYAENEGEVTDETELLEGQVSAMKALLNSEGVDFLGRWLRGKEDKKKALKAEKDYLSRQMEAIDRTISFIKAKITEVMNATGCEKVKGSLGYSFARTTSTKTEVNRDLLNDWYLADIEKALAEIGVPNWVTIKLDAKVSEVPEGTELPKCFNRTETDTVRFTKPRASKED